MDSFLFWQMAWGWQKDMSKKFVSKTGVMLLSWIMYPYVSKKKFNQLTKLSATKILSIIQPIFLNLFIYLFIYKGKRCDKHYYEY